MPARYGWRACWWGVAALLACSRSRHTEESPVRYGGSLDAGAVEAGTLASSEGGPEDGSRSDGGGAGTAAFPELAGRAEWKIVSQRMSTGTGLWVAIAEGTPDAGPIEAWPAARVALTREVGKAFVPVAAGELSEQFVQCEAVESGAVERSYRVELDEAYEGVVPGEVIVPLRVTCERQWPAAEQDIEYLILLHPNGARLEDVLHVQTGVADLDRVKQSTTETRWVWTAVPARDAARPRVCSRESGQPSKSTRGGGCFEWNGTRFQHVR
jgi:hypothetical protein